MQKFELTPDQISTLNAIYIKRRNLVLGAMAAVPVLALGGFYRREFMDDDQFLLFQVIYFIVMLVFLLIMAIMMIVKIRPLSRDIKYRSGVLQNSTILSKSHFPFVGTYFFFLDHPDITNKEVSGEEFEKYAEGDTYLVPMGENSKIVLDGFMNYDLL